MLKEKDLKILEEKKKKLQKRDNYLIISDFDDTIFCRKEQLEDSELLRNNRWNKWNYIIKHKIWIGNFINKYYKNKTFPNTIIKELRVNHDLILTSWYTEIQTEKIKACKLDYINNIITKNADDKIIETIKYIVNKLWFIPEKIIVYEDKPEYFIEYRKFLEDFLETNLEIYYVEMISNENEPKITKID